MKVIKILLVLVFMFSFSTIAFAEKGGGGAGTGGGGTSVVTPDCPESSAQGDMGKGGGVSGNKDDTSAHRIGEAIKAYEEGMDKVITAGEKGMTEGIDETIDWLDDCIAGLNTNIFSGDFSGIFNKIIDAIKKKMCSFAKRQSQDYLNQALNMVSYDLPFGLGKVGANTNILGYQMTQTSTTGSASDSGLKMNAQEQREAGVDMFKRAGGVFSRELDKGLGFGGF